MISTFGGIETEKKNPTMTEKRTKSKNMKKKKKKKKRLDGVN